MCSSDLAVPRLRLTHSSAPDPLYGAWDQLHQATGMVMSTLNLSALDALDTLRARSFANGQLLTDLASDIVTGREKSDLDHR